MDRPTESIIRDIIKDSMGIDGQNIWISSQNITIPSETEEMFIIVGMTDAVPMSNNTRSDFSVEPYKEIQTTQVRENIQVEILSRNESAFLRRWEILTSIGSNLSKQAQEEHNFKIGKISTSFANTSATEGSSQINRFSIVIPCIVWYTIIKEISETEYYDTFPTRVDAEETIGEAEGLIDLEFKEEE